MASKDSFLITRINKENKREETVSAQGTEAARVQAEPRTPKVSPGGGSHGDKKGQGARPAHVPNTAWGRKGSLSQGTTEHFSIWQWSFCRVGVETWSWEGEFCTFYNRPRLMMGWTNIGAQWEWGREKRFHKGLGVSAEGEGCTWVFKDWDPYSKDEFHIIDGGLVHLDG